MCVSVGEKADNTGAMRDKGKVRGSRLKAEKSGRKVSSNACKITSQVRQEKKKRNILAGNSASRHTTTMFPELIPCLKKINQALWESGRCWRVEKKRPVHSRASWWYKNSKRQQIWYVLVCNQDGVLWMEWMWRSAWIDDPAGPALQNGAKWSINKWPYTGMSGTSNTQLIKSHKCTYSCGRLALNRLKFMSSLSC